MSYLSNRTRACRAFEIGYDLDSGGHEVEPAPEWGRDVVRWEDPEHDYFPFFDLDDSRGDSTVLVVEIDDVFRFKFPPIVRESADSALVLVSHGETLASDHECWACTPAFEEYEDQDDQRADCDRCEGTGLVDSPSTSWALYRRVDSVPCACTGGDGRTPGTGPANPDCDDCDGDGVVPLPDDYGVSLPLETGVDPE